MTIKSFLACLVCALALGCGRRADEAAAPRTPQSAPESPAPPDAGAANLVRIEEGMQRDLHLTTASVESRPGGEQIVLLGELAVDQRLYAEVGAPVAARVTRLLVTPGDAVGRGQTLAELTSPDLARARADYLSAAARVTLADTALERKRGLAAERIVPLREVQEAESAAVEARAALRASRAALAPYGVDLPSNADDDGSSTFVLRSPVSGTAIERNAVVGQMLDPGRPAFRIGDLSTLWLTVHAFERDAVRIQQGVTARLSFAALPGQDFQGRVTVVGREVERESRTVPVRIDVRNTGAVLRPGMSATASLPAGASGTPILSVPIAAVQRVRNEWCVFLPRDGRSFEIRRIGRGRDLPGEIEVLSGLRAGETIVVEGAFLLKAQAEKREADHDAH